MPQLVWILSGNDYAASAFTNEADARKALANHIAREKQHREEALAKHTAGQGLINWWLCQVPLNPGVSS